MLEDLIEEFNKICNPEKAKASSWFFKTGEGQYGYGDQFIGVTVPEQRKLAKKYKDSSLAKLEGSLASPIHEHRLTSLFILVLQYQKAKDKKPFADFYLKNLKFVNNWDLVDSSAPYILGDYLLDKPKEQLYKLARSKDLWERRVAMISCGGFIKKNEFSDALEIAEILVGDKEDLIQKAVGWMLREIGNRDLKMEEKFLDKHYLSMPRTMLRYAIEKFSPKKKAHYMGKTNLLK